MTTPDDPNFWSKTAAAAAAIASALAAAVWGDMKMRVGKVESKLDGKADQTEMDTQRKNITKLFEGQASLKDFVHLEVKELGRQVTQMEKVAIRLEEQMGRFASDIESEKRTRAEANRQINDKLDELMHGIERRIKPR